MDHIRDFVYLDIERVRSLISQLEQGIVETISKTLGDESSLDGELKANVFGLASGTVGVEQLWRRDVQENKSLHDYVYTKLETQLVKAGLLKVVDSAVLSEEPSAAAFRSELSSTDFILIRSNVELDDLSRIRSVVEKINELGKFIAWTSVQGLGLNEKSGSEYQKAIKVAESKVLIDKKMQEGIALVIRELIGEKVILRVGRSDSHIRFVGILDQNLLREDMRSILIKYGSRPAEPWHIFCQVASLQPNSQAPTGITADSGIHGAFSKIFDTLRQIDRVVMPYAESDITITPIAVYRQPPAD